MKPLSVEMACLLGIQNEIQAVCIWTNKELDLKWPKLKNASENSYKKCKKFINSKLPNWPNPDQVLFYKKNPLQEFIIRTLSFAP